jgi:deoxyadenosine/deoxycytidine kinase
MSALAGDLILNGNIGSGKTTLGRRLALEHGYVFFDEPVDDWDYLLGRIYKDGDVWLTPLFQAKVMSYYVSVTERILKMGVGRTRRIVVTRSPRSTLLFVEANRAAFGKKFLRALGDFVEMLEANFPFWLEARNVCLYQTADDCFANMNARATVEKDAVPLTYLEKLEILHHDYANRHGWEFVHAVDLDKAMARLLVRRPTKVAEVQAEEV